MVLPSWNLLCIPVIGNLYLVKSLKRSLQGTYAGALDLDGKHACMTLQHKSLPPAKRTTLTFCPYCAAASPVSTSRSTPGIARTPP
jgi:hypothetical protein